MTELLTSAQMRAIERAAIEGGEVTGPDLMERAGRGVVEAVFEAWPELAKTSHRAVVLCGPGNNGGDGFVVARLLTEWGWDVEVFLYGDPDKLPPDARVNHDRWCRMGAVAALSDDRFDGWPNAMSGHALVIDAVFGTGLARPYLAHPHLAATLNRCQSKALASSGHPKVVAVDVPSGLCADSGRWLGDDLHRSSAPLANLTVTFHRAKAGHFLCDGPSSCGLLRLADIGLGGDGARPAGAASSVQHDVVRVVDETSVRRAGDKRSGHKYTHGHALILSGPAGRGGAARLAARGALRIGAGLVTVGCPVGAVPENAARLDAVMLREVEGAEDLSALLADRRLNALCVGPGLGTGARDAQLVAAALTRHLPDGLPLIDATDAQVAAFLKKFGHRPACVLDADALTLLAGDPALLAMLHDRCVLTPHAGEFARLFPDIAEKLAAPATRGPAYSKVDATREAAARAGCVVLFKGPDTVIADPSGRCAVSSADYDRAAPWLATAGSGDVLAGFIAGLLARGFAPMEAAEAAAWLHVECARSFGPGLIAEDIPEQLPGVFRALGL